MSSTVTVFGAVAPLRDGEIILGDDYVSMQRWYVGGQSARSYARAWMLMESLLDAPGWRVSAPGDWLDTPSPCASVRFGNCLSFTLEAVEAQAT